MVQRLDLCATSFNHHASFDLEGRREFIPLLGERLREQSEIAHA
jgi:hypothetical protein